MSQKKPQVKEKYKPEGGSALWNRALFPASPNMSIFLELGCLTGSLRLSLAHWTNADSPRVLSSPSLRRFCVLAEGVLFGCRYEGRLDCFILPGFNLCLFLFAHLPGRGGCKS